MGGKGDVLGAWRGWGQGQVGLVSDRGVRDRKGCGQKRGLGGDRRTEGGGVGGRGR